MQAATIKATHFKQVYNALRIFHPNILEDIKPKLIKPEPVLKHTILFPSLLKRFCELKGVSAASLIGPYQGQEAADYRMLFIAVIITLYHPELLTRLHSENMKSNLSEELSGLLEIERTLVSRATNKITGMLNPYRAMPAYQNFKEEVEKISKALEIEFSK